MSVMFKIGIQFFYLHISLKNILLFSVYPFNFSALFLALIVSVLPKEYWNIA